MIPFHICGEELGWLAALYASVRHVFPWARNHIRVHYARLRKR